MATIGLLLLSPLCAHTQVAGLNTLTSLDLSPYGRVSSLGMDYLSVFSDDPTVGLSNPSMLTSEMAHSVVASVVPVFAGANMGALGYVHSSKRLGVFSVALNYFNYGRFDRYDEEETPLGSFGASDYTFSIGWGLRLDSNFSVGASFKPTLSQYAEYTAFSVAFDVAASWMNDARTLAATLMLRNVGAQIVTFDEKTESLPLELSAEVSYKLRNAPFRLYLAATELQRWNLRYEDPLSPSTTVDPFTGEVTTTSPVEAVASNIIRHLQAGVELSFSRSFYARVGYSPRRSSEMRGFDALSFSGLSFGVGFRMRRFEFSYARHNYHLSQSPNYFTLTYRF